MPSRPKTPPPAPPSPQQSPPGAGPRPAGENGGGREEKAALGPSAPRRRQPLSLELGRDGLAEPANHCLESGPPWPISAPLPSSAARPATWAAEAGGAAAMSDWDTSSDEDAGAPGRPPSSAVAGRLWQPPATPSQSRASVEGGGERRSAEWWREAAAASLGREEWEPRDAEGSGGSGEAAWRRPPPRVTASQVRDAVAPLCFHLDNTLVGALIGNNSCS